MYFSFVGNVLECLEKREIFFAHRPIFSNVSIVRVSKTVRVILRCLYSILIEHLFEETNQSTNLETEQMLRLYTNELARNRDPIEQWACQLVERLLLLVIRKELYLCSEVRCCDLFYSYGTSCALCILYSIHDNFLPPQFFQDLS